MNTHNYNKYVNSFGIFEEFYGKELKFEAINEIRNFRNINIDNAEINSKVYIEDISLLRDELQTYNIHNTIL